MAFVYESVIANFNVAFLLVIAFVLLKVTKGKLPGI